MAGEENTANHCVSAFLSNPAIIQTPLEQPIEAETLHELNLERQNSYGVLHLGKQRRPRSGYKSHDYSGHDHDFA